MENKLEQVSQLSRSSSQKNSFRQGTSPNFSAFLWQIEREREASCYNKLIQKINRKCHLEHYIMRKKILPGSLETFLAMKKRNKPSFMIMRSGKVLEERKNSAYSNTHQLKANNCTKIQTLHNPRESINQRLSVKQSFKEENWKLILTEEEKNELFYGKELKMGKEMRMKYMGKQNSLQNRSLSKKNRIKSIGMPVEKKKTEIRKKRINPVKLKFIQLAEKENQGE